MGDIIDVACLAFPNGDTFHTDDPGSVERYVAEWKARHPKYAGLPVLGGFVILRMLREDYHSIPARSSDLWDGRANLEGGNG